MDPNGNIEKDVATTATPDKKIHVDICADAQTILQSAENISSIIKPETEIWQESLEAISLLEALNDSMPKIDQLQHCQYLRISGINKFPTEFTIKGKKMALEEAKHWIQGNAKNFQKKLNILEEAKHKIQAETNVEGTPSVSDNIVLLSINNIVRTKKKPINPHKAFAEDIINKISGIQYDDQVQYIFGKTVKAELEALLKEPKETE